MRVGGIALLAGTVFIFGCATPPPDQSHKLSVRPPVNWTAHKEGPVKAFEDGWIGDFSDNRLEGIIGEALTHNFNLLATAARLESARSTAIIEGADRWPQISAGQSNSRRQRTGAGGFAITSSRSNNFNLSLDLSWEIDLWGKLRNRHRAAIADWQAAEEDYRAARLSLAAQTAQAWFNAIEAELQVDLARETVKSFEANLGTVEQRFRAGITRALDLRLTRANVANAQSNFASRRRQRDVAVRGLEVLLGRYPSYDLGTSMALPVIGKTIPAGLPAELVSRRPDILAAEQRLAAAEQRVGEAKKARLPAIRLTSSGGTSTDEFAELLNTEFKVWSLASGITQPIFQGRRLKANMKRSQAEHKRAWATYSQQVLTAFREVETALAAESYLTAQEAALKRAVDESIGAEELVWDQYGKGLNDIITVLESQRRSFDSKRQLLQISNERLQNRVDLYLALGGDFGNPAAKLEGLSRTESVDGEGKEIVTEATEETDDSAPNAG